MNLLNQVLELFGNFAMIGGSIWLVWGLIVTAGALKDQNGPQIQSGVWQVVGGGLIIAGAALFKALTAS